jgi:hypothetical protein
VGVIEKLDMAPSEQMGQVLFLGSCNLSKYVAHHKQDSYSMKWGSVKSYFLCSIALKIKGRLSFKFYRGKLLFMKLVKVSKSQESS